jgi:hypothetical protein
VALFRRGAKGRTAQDETAGGVDAPEDTADRAADAGTTDVVADDAPSSPVPDRSAGPWDAQEDVPAGPRVDLGALRLPGVHGMELRMEIDKKSGTVTAVGVTLDGFALSIPIGQIVLLVLLTGILGVVAAIRPARRAARVEVLEAIAGE